MTKITACLDCGRPKNLRFFYKAGGRNKGLRNVCIECHTKRAVNPDTKRKLNRSKYTFHGRFLRALAECKRTHHPWGLPEPDYALIASKPCHYCGKLSVSMGIGLDRIDNSRGYELGNVLSACAECNRVRSNKYTVEETQVMIREMLKYRAETNIKRSLLLGQYFL